MIPTFLLFRFGKVSKPRGWGNGYSEQAVQVQTMVSEQLERVTAAEVLPTKFRPSSWAIRSPHARMIRD